MVIVHRYFLSLPEGIPLFITYVSMFHHYPMHYQYYPIGNLSVVYYVDQWVWVNTYRYIFSGMNIHLPAILGFTRYQDFDPSPDTY